jgi:hypothetical protein
VKIKALDAVVIVSMCAAYILVVLPLFLRAKGAL